MGIESIDIDIIMRQTGIKDKIIVRKTYFKCNKNVSDTILELMSLTPDNNQDIKPKDIKPKDIKLKDIKPKTEIEKLRIILDEKEKIFQKITANEK
jgi:hypothetical protein